MFWIWIFSSIFCLFFWVCLSLKVLSKFSWCLTVSSKSDYLSLASISSHLTLYSIVLLTSGFMHFDCSSTSSFTSYVSSTSSISFTSFYYPSNFTTYLFSSTT